MPWLLGARETRDQSLLVAALHAGSCAGIAWALRRQLGALNGRTGVPFAAVTAATATAAVRRHGGAPVTSTGIYRLLLAAAVVVKSRRAGAP